MFYKTTIIEIQHNYNRDIGAATNLQPPLGGLRTRTSSAPAILTAHAQTDSHFKKIAHFDNN